MLDKQRVERCRAKLVAAARSRRTITYSELAEFLRVANQSVGKYLNEIYNQEMSQGRPDLTVVVVYVDTEMGRYNSKGGPPQSVQVDPDNPKHVRAYKAELSRVYKQWSRI